MELRVTDEVIMLANRHRVQGLLVEGDRRPDRRRGQGAGRALGVRGPVWALAGREPPATAVLTLGVLGCVGVEARVLKGVAARHLDYAHATGGCSATPTC